MKYKSRQKKRIHKMQATCAAQQTILSPICDNLSEAVKNVSYGIPFATYYCGALFLFTLLYIIKVY